MSETTKIEWADHTASPWYGCSRVHTGCINCYAEALAKRNPATLGVWGPQGTRVLSASFHRDVIKWNRQAAAIGKRASVFPSLCDPFDDWDGPMVNARGLLWAATMGMGTKTDAKWENQFAYDERRFTMSDARAELFATIDACKMLDFLLLTKRPGNVKDQWPTVDDCGIRWHVKRPNVQLIYSASDQASFDAGINDLVACSDLVPVLGLSLEPLVGPIDLNLPWIRHADGTIEKTSAIDWVIVGGESGPNARPCNIAWVRDIVRQCKEAGVPCFVKQLGANVLDMTTGESCRVRLNDNKGGNWDEWPEDLKVRQFPVVEVAV